MTHSPPVLGVTRSLRGRPWQMRLDTAGEALALAIAQLGGLGDIPSRILASRGIAPDAVAAYLDPAVRDLMPDPSTLVDMDRAVTRLADAVQQRETIAIFGDYDVDGAASSALLADYLASLGVPHMIHIPDRLFEGYGPNVEAVRLLAQRGATLLVAVDCGTTSPAALAEAQTLGLDPIVLDHHQAPEHLPDAIVVNPNRLDDLSGLGQLCAAGVVLMALVGLQRELRTRGLFAGRAAPDLLAALDLVALATVADVAPLTGLNRAFVKKGLAVMRARGRPGLRALLDVAAAVGAPTTYHLGYLVGPRINAGGRIGDAALGARLLTLTDDDEANAIAAQLDTLNRERQAMEMATLELAEAEALAQVGLDDAGAAVVVTAGEGWHPGIVGIIAGRLREKFGRPAFAIALPEGARLAHHGGEAPLAEGARLAHHGGEAPLAEGARPEHHGGEAPPLRGTGSGRSIPGVDLGRAVRAAVDAGVLAKGGGHAMAAGVTLGAGGVAAFRDFIEAELAAAATAAREADALAIDATLTAAGATPALVADLERAGPFGSGSPEPVFVLPAHRIADVGLVGKGHVRLRAQAGDGTSIDGICFRAADEPLGKALLASRGEKLHLAGTLAVDRWGGRERVQLRLLDAALPTRG